MAGGSGSKEQWSSTWGFLLAAVGFAGDSNQKIEAYRKSVPRESHQFAIVLKRNTKDAVYVD